MTFAAEWEEAYRKNAHLSVWPWSDLITYVMRYARPTGPDFRVLEIGAGAGANVPFFRALNVNYHGIDGSPTIIENLRARFSDMHDKFSVADFSRDLAIPGLFDLIVDRAALTSNSEADIRACLKLVHQKLKPRGRFISIDMYSTKHSEHARGKRLDDHTRTDFMEGDFAHVGPVHFSDEAHLRSLFADFEIEVLEHKTIQRIVPANSREFGSYNVVGRKHG